MSKIAEPEETRLRVHRSSREAIRRLADGSFWSLLGDSLLLVSGLVTIAYLTRSLGTEGYGRFVLAITVAGWIGWTISSLCPARTVIKLLNEEADVEGVSALVLRVHLLFGGLGFAFMAMLSVPLAGLFRDPLLAPYLALASLEILLFSLAHGQRKLLIGVGSYRRQALGNAAKWIVRLVAIVALVELGLSVAGALIGGMIAILAEALIYRQRLRTPLLRTPGVPVRRLLISAVPLFLFAVTLQLVTKIDLLAVKLFGGTIGDAGIYGAAHTLASVPLILTGSLAALLLSSVMRVRKHGDEAGARRLARDGLRLSLAMIPVAAIVAGSSEEIVGWLFTDEFSPAADMLSVLIFAPVAAIVVFVATVIPVALDRAWLTAAVAIGWLIAAATGYGWAIPRFGPLGAAWVASLSSALAATVALALAQYLWRASPAVGSFLRVGATAVLMYAAADMWPAAGALIVVKVGILGVLTLAVLRLTGEFDWATIESVRAQWSPKT